MDDEILDAYIRIPNGCSDLSCGHIDNAASVKNEIDSSKVLTGISRYNSLLGFKIIDASGFSEKFFKLPAISKRKLLYKALEIDFELMKDYLAVLSIIEFHEPEFVKPGHGIEGFFMNPERPTEKREIYRSLDEDYLFSTEFSHIADDLSKMMGMRYSYQKLSEYVESNYHTVYFTGLFLLKHHFGESLVTEVINRLIDDRVFIGLKSLIKLLEDWKNLREYPVEWSVSTLDIRDREEMKSC